MSDLPEYVTVPRTMDEAFFVEWMPYLLVGGTFIVTLLLAAIVGYAVYTHKKKKIGKQVKERVEYVTKSMLYGYVNGTVHPTIQDVHQTGNYVQINGVKCLDCRTTSYLKLDMLPEVKAQAKEMIDRYGSARCVTQMYFKLPLINQLIQKIETVTGGHVLIASSVTSGHFAVIPVLVGANFDSLIVLDRRVHNSVTLATQVCQGNKSIRCEYNDMGHLESILKKNRSRPAVWYFCDGIYSMSGAGAAVPQLIDLLRRYPNLHIYCDDAHGTLWHHNAGYFLGEMFRLGVSITEFGDRLIVALALGKCYASGGGAFVFSSPRIRSIVRSCGPTLTFNTIVNPSELGSALCITDMALSGQLAERQARLARLIQFRERETRNLELVKSGAMIPTDSISPISIISFKHTPEIEAILNTYNWINGFGYGIFASEVTNLLKKAGFLVNVTAFPAVALKDAGVRFAIHSEMSEEEILAMLNGIQDCCKQATQRFIAGEPMELHLTTTERVFEELGLPSQLRNQPQKQKAH